MKHIITFLLLISLGNLTLANGEGKKNKEKREMITRNMVLEVKTTDGILTRAQVRMQFWLKGDQLCFGIAPDDSYHEAYRIKQKKDKQLAITYADFKFEQEASSSATGAKTVQFASSGKEACVNFEAWSIKKVNPEMGAFESFQEDKVQSIVFYNHKSSEQNNKGAKILTLEKNKTAGDWSSFAPGGVIIMDMETAFISGDPLVKLLNKMQSTKGL